MMTEQKNSAADKLREFLTTKNSKTNASMIQAQKMINLYRSLEDFGDDFVDQYNQELLQIPNNAELMLNALVGGVEVRQYLDYLRHQSDKEKAQQDQANNERPRGYLPGPESDMPDTDTKDQPQYITQADFEKFKSEQMDLINQMMQRLASKPEAPAPQLGPAAPAAQHVHAAMDYSEIIEEKQPGSDAMAGFNNGGNK